MVTWTHSSVESVKSLYHYLFHVSDIKNACVAKQSSANHLICAKNYESMWYECITCFVQFSLRMVFLRILPCFRNTEIAVWYFHGHWDTIWYPDWSKSSVTKLCLTSFYGQLDISCVFVTDNQHRLWGHSWESGKSKLFLTSQCTLYTTKVYPKQFESSQQVSLV